MPYSYEPHYFEDFEVGQTFQSAGRTVTEADLVLQSAFSADWTELHTNAEYAGESYFGERVAHGPFTFQIATGLLFRTGIVERTVFAFTGMNYMDLPQPVTIGDTLSLAMEVTEKEDIGRDDAGSVVIDTTMHNQDDEVVYEGDMRFLIKKRE